MATRTREERRGRCREAVPDEAYLEPLGGSRNTRRRAREPPSRGAVAGISAGFVFLLANMAYATSEGKRSLAPFADISTIFSRDGQARLDGADARPAGDRCSS